MKKTFFIFALLFSFLSVQAMNYEKLYGLWLAVKEDTPVECRRTTSWTIANGACCYALPWNTCYQQSHLAYYKGGLAAAPSITALCSSISPLYCCVGAMCCVVGSCQE